MTRRTHAHAGEADDASGTPGARRRSPIRRLLEPARLAGCMGGEACRRARRAAEERADVIATYRRIASRASAGLNVSEMAERISRSTGNVSGHLFEEWVARDWNALARLTRGSRMTLHDAPNHPGTDAMVSRGGQILYRVQIKCSRNARYIAETVRKAPLDAVVVVFRDAERTARAACPGHAVRAAARASTDVRRAMRVGTNLAAAARLDRLLGDRVRHLAAPELRALLARAGLRRAMRLGMGGAALGAAALSALGDLGALRLGAVGMAWIAENGAWAAAEAAGQAAAAAAATTLAATFLSGSATALAASTVIGTTAAAGAVTVAGPVVVGLVAGAGAAYVLRRARRALREPRPVVPAPDLGGAAAAMA